MGAQALKAVGVFLFNDMIYKVMDKDEEGAIELYLNGLSLVTIKMDMDNNYPYFICLDSSQKVEDLIEALTILKEKADFDE